MNRRRLLERAAALVLAPSLVDLAPPLVAPPVGVATVTLRADTVAFRSALSLAASGGLCAPVEPYYPLMLLGVEPNPIRASLPRLAAERGAIRFSSTGA